VPTEPFRRRDVTAWPALADETAGVEEKMWLLEPSTERAWLYKPVTFTEGYECGEDWAEKAVAQLGEMLGIPCASVDLAQRGERRGSISADLRPTNYEMQHGQLFMEAYGVAGYVPGKVRGRPGHSVENIQKVLEGVRSSPGYVLPFEASGFDVFAGYLVLDAWVANRDRHDENWSVLRPITGEAPTCLCGSYDHANSLGYNLDDDKRSLLVADPARLRRWCSKGTAYRFEHVPGKAAPTLVQTAVKGLGLASTQAREHWPHQLEQVGEDVMRQVIERIPGMSEAARSFALEVLVVNRKRVLDACT
jgi:hypothetical protein